MAQADDQANFARGTEASVTQSQEDAYAAMAMQDTLCSPLGLDSARSTLVLSDVRAQPSKKDDGYATLETEGDLPDTTAIIQTLMLHRDLILLIMSNQMIYLIVDNRMPTDVPHWPAFAAWWASRRCLVGPQMGRCRVWQGSPPVPTYATRAESSPAAPSSPTAATPGLSQWSLVEATFVTAATTYCLLASAWVSSAG